MVGSYPFWTVSATPPNIPLYEAPNNAALDKVALDQTHENPGVFKLVNFNIIGPVDTVENNWTEILVAENAEVLALVETGRWKLSDGSWVAAVEQINALFPNEIPYKAAMFSTDPVGTTDGQAIFSRFPMLDSYTVYEFALDDGSIHVFSHPLIVALLDIDGHEIYIVSMHNFCCDAELRSIEQEATNNFFDSLGADAAIIYSGDNNEVPPEKLIYDPEKFQSSYGDSVEMILNSSHPQATVNHVWVDTYRALNPDIYQHTGYTAEDNSGFLERIDYTFVNQHFEGTLVSSVAKLRDFDHGHLTNIFNLNPDDVNLRPPLPPIGISIEVDVDNIQSTISWDANTEEDFYKYKLYRNKCLITELPKGETSFVDNYHYESNKIYNYEMRAVDWVENISPLSAFNYINSTTGNLGLPGQPELVASTTSGGILLSWTLQDGGNTPILQYEIKRASSFGILASEFTFVDGSTSNFTSSISRAGITIYYQIRAINVVGPGPLSKIAFAPSGLTSQSVLTNSRNQYTDSTLLGHEGEGGCPDTIQEVIYVPPPAQVTGLVGTVISTTQIDLMWTANSESNIASYNIYRDGVKIGSPSITSFADMELLASTEYSYEISAVGGDGQEGLKSEAVLLTTQSTSVSTTSDETSSQQSTDDNGSLTLFISIFVVTNIVIILIRKKQS
ncbi:MAG: hypothetical protein IH840_12470 [Candidatus Heimdallarchaeota archaeon]|nr:hypothetical protein [Candidatus Heimdallarchaeota archaeon]